VFGVCRLGHAVNRRVVTFDATVSVARLQALAIAHVPISSRWGPEWGVLLRAAVGSVADELLCDALDYLNESVDGGSGSWRHRSA
jgi:hypothetical protein